MSRLLGDSTNIMGKFITATIVCILFHQNNYLLGNHIDFCKLHGAQETSILAPNDYILRFKNLNNQLKAPFVIYADWKTFPLKLFVQI